MLAHNLHKAVCNQQQKRWDRDVAQKSLTCKAGRSQIVGVGNIGQSLARVLALTGCAWSAAGAPIGPRRWWTACTR